MFFHTVSSMHLTSLTAPAHPRNDKSDKRIPATINMYTAPVNKLVPKSSLMNDLSNSVYTDMATNTIPPICKQI